MNISANDFPLVIRPTNDCTTVADLFRAYRSHLEGAVLSAGALLFRDFRRSILSEILEVIDGMSHLQAGALVEDKAPIIAKIYDAAPVPPAENIRFHVDIIKQNVWPRKMFFLCHIPAQQGGATLLADCRQVYSRIDPGIISTFEKKQVLIKRNFRRDLGKTWQQAFQSEDRTAVETYCVEAGISCEWVGPEWLRTSLVVPAVITQRVTGAKVWANNALYFHAGPGPRESADGELSSNSFYGDGTHIPTTVIQQLAAAYASESSAVNWQRGDVLLIDNTAVAHGRAPFTGDRKISVGIAELSTISEVAGPTAKELRHSPF